MHRHAGGEDQPPATLCAFAQALSTCRPSMRGSPESEFSTFEEGSLAQGTFGQRRLPPSLQIQSTAL